MIFFIVIAAICLVVLLLMQFSTNHLMKELEDAFYCTDYYIEESTYNQDPEAYSSVQGKNYIPYDPNIPNIYAHFNFTGHFSANESEIKTDLNLWRIFAWHNFSKGTMWIKYSVEVFNANGERLTGSWDVTVRLSIQKTDGEWVVTHIDEAP